MIFFFAQFAQARNTRQWKNNQTNKLQITQVETFQLRDHLHFETPDSTIFGI